MGECNDGRNDPPTCRCIGGGEAMMMVMTSMSLTSRNEAFTLHDVSQILNDINNNLNHLHTSTGSHVPPVKPRGGEVQCIGVVVTLQSE